MSINLRGWKLIAVIILLLFFIGRFFSNQNEEDCIANIEINNIIEDDILRVKILSSIERNNHVKALIVNINSPGGSVVGSEMLYTKLLNMAKPVVVVMGSLATSGAYLVSLGADHIIAHNGTLTGSIGVIMQSAEVTQLAEKLGIKFHNFKSNPLKASPNLTEKVTPEVHEATMNTIHKTYDYFVELIALRRNLDIESVRKLADGRIYVARTALELNLIDEIGNYDTALAWLYKDKNISKELKIIDYQLHKDQSLFDFIIKNYLSLSSDFLYKNYSGLRSIFNNYVK